MYIFGASGHGKVILRIAESLNVTVEGFIDDNLDIEIFQKLPVKRIQELASLGNPSLVIGIGVNSIREKIASELTESKFEILIHPTSYVCDSVKIGEGTVVMPGAIINVDAQLGKHCIINSGAVVEHDCILEDFVHVSPNASLAGNVQVGKGTHIGIGAAVKQNISIGKNVTIGAGAVVVKDVPDNATVIGVPGKIIKTRN